MHEKVECPVAGDNTFEKSKYYTQREREDISSSLLVHLRPFLPGHDHAASQMHTAPTPYYSSQSVLLSIPDFHNYTANSSPPWPLILRYLILLPYLALYTTRRVTWMLLRGGTDFLKSSSLDR